VENSDKASKAKEVLALADGSEWGEKGLACSANWSSNM
jgi:hypothetical protein